MLEVKVIGAGLAGCEAAWQIARRGIAAGQSGPDDVNGFVFHLYPLKLSEI